MNINNNFTPLAWHRGNIELQSNRATYAYGHIVPLYASSTSLVPFQIITESGEFNVNSYNIRLRHIDGSLVTGDNLWQLFRLVKVTVGSYDVVIFDGHTFDPELSISELPIGQYYFSLTSYNTGGNVTWYSDVVTIVSDVSKMTKITWYDALDLKFGEGLIKYRYKVSGVTYQYKNWMYFHEELGMPEYTVEEEGETRDGLFYSSKIVSGKKYKMQVEQLTETMCDALRFVHLSDFVTVRDGYGREYSCDSVLITPEWKSGSVASAAVEIVTDTFVKSVGDSNLVATVIDVDTNEVGRAVIGENFVL